MGLSHIGKIIGHCHSGFRCRVSGVSSKKVRAGLRLALACRSPQVERGGSITFLMPSLSLTLNVEPPGPDLNLRCSIIQIHIWEPDTDRNMIL
jgi:hypothetical protein